MRNLSCLAMQGHQAIRDRQRSGNDHNNYSKEKPTEDHQACATPCHTICPSYMKNAVCTLNKNFDT
jgi:hypothetical protein